MLVERKAKSACIEFFQATIEAAPSKDQIRQDVKARGWRVKRKAGAWPYRKGEKATKPDGPLNRMRAAVIGRRIKAVYYVATGWLPAVRQLGAKSTGGKVRIVEVKNPRGKASITFNGRGDITVMVSNSTPGIAKVEAKHHILRRGFNKASADIIKYLRAKDAGRSGKTVGGNR